MIDTVHSYSGDVMKFAGDAMVIAFYPSPQEVCHADGGLQAAVTRCAHCACELARCLGHMRMLPNGEVQSISHKDFIALQEQEEAEARAKAALLASAAASEATSKSENPLSWLAQHYSNRGFPAAPKVRAGPRRGRHSHCAHRHPRSPAGLWAVSGLPGRPVERGRSAGAIAHGVRQHARVISDAAPAHHGRQPAAGGLGGF